MDINRRSFARRLAAGATLGAAGIATGQEAVPVNPDNRPKFASPRARDREPERPDFPHLRTSGQLSADGSVFLENSREIKVVDDFDVLVCGGGPAGFTAALAAARSGAKTGILDVNGCLGGVWTAGMLSWILDAKGKPGLMAELVRVLEEGRNGQWRGGAFVYHPDEMKMVLEQMLLEAGVRIRLHTRVVGALTDDQHRLTTVVTESKSGREAWTSKTFIDATGDGDLSMQAGCEFDYGRAGDGVTQPFSLMALLTGVSYDDIAPFVRDLAEPRGLGNPKRNLLEEFRRAGIEPSYGGPTIFPIREGLFAMMANHQYQVSAINADDVTRATMEARNEVHQLIDSVRKLGGGWQGVELVCTGEQIGTREGRRIHGRYEVDSEDLQEGARFEDAICRVHFPIDVHATEKSINGGEIESKPFRSQPYDIPLRSLITRDVDGLMMAGRCISGDFIAHSSYRVTGNAVVMGEASGITSAIAAKNGVLPHEVPFEELLAAQRG